MRTEEQERWNLILWIWGMGVGGRRQLMMRMGRIVEIGR